MNKKILLGLLVGVAASVVCGCGKKEDNTAKFTANPSSVAGQNANDDEDGTGLMSGKHHIEIVMKDYGTIKVELDADQAPITVTNFISLANDGFYDGLTLHRIIEGFMMQGGDPLGNGTGGSDKEIKGEFTENGVENNIKHTRGTISMARSMDMNSASSQFFIMHKDSASLDGKYAAFGYVTDGMDIVDKICEEAEPTDNNGTIPASKQPVIQTIKVID